MPRVLNTFLTCVFLVVLAGCAGRATVTESQCVAGDWQTIGYRDGQNGLRSSRLLNHTDACGEYEIVPDRKQYMLGWREGVREYCSPGNGYAVGAAGAVYQNVCPEDLRRPFLAAYQDGRQVHMVKTEINRLSRAIDQKSSRLESVKGDIVATATAQLDPELTTADRVSLLARTQRLTEERVALEAELVKLEKSLAREGDRLQTLTRSVANVSY